MRKANTMGMLLIKLVDADVSHQALIRMTEEMTHRLRNHGKDATDS